MTELDELIKQRKALEKDTAQRNAIEKEKGKIKELQEQRENDRKSKTVFGKIKKTSKISILRKLSILNDSKRMAQGEKARQVGNNGKDPQIFHGNHKP